MSAAYDPSPMHRLRLRLLGWRLPIRLARREAMRARGRSVLVLVMICVPVLSVVTTAVLIATTDVSMKEGLDRRLGTAAALVNAREGVTELTQTVNPDNGGWTDAPDHARPTPAAIRRVLGDRPMEQVRLDEYRAVRTDAGVADGVQVAELDPTGPLARGMFTLSSGRWPRTGDEVVVNAYLAGRGPGLGEELTLPGQGSGPDRAKRVVGIAESATVKNEPVALGLLGAFGLPDSGSTSWLVGGGPVSWADVVRLNGIGATALSRAVVLDPPAAAVESGGGSVGSGQRTVVVLIIVMALIEVVLLAGPAFAVGARRQSRALALMAASGGTPAQARRVVLASGIVLGLGGALIGCALGVPLARALLPLVQDHSGDWLGPFEVPWLIVVGVAGFGLVSALLAAVVPAWVASRQDVVAVLAGRRGDRRPSVRSPLLGLLLLGLGVAGAVLGTRKAEYGETAIAGAAILCVLGMVLLVPVVVAVVARLARRLPLPLRFAARDAARHRTRTAPAVAAVAATVAGVVALGIAVSSDERENRETYTASLPLGQGTITANQLTPQEWDRARAVVGKYLPAATTTAVTGVPYLLPTDDGSTRSVELGFRADGDDQLPGSSNGTGGSALVAAGNRLPGWLREDVPELDAATTARAERALAAGGAVVFTMGHPDTTQAALHAAVDDDSGEAITSHDLTVPAAFVHVGGGTSVPAGAVLAPALAKRLGLPTATVGLVLGGDLPEDRERDAAEALQAIGDGRWGAPSLYVERGYQATSETVIVEWVLAALGALLMLGGTLTATFLALSDARPDLATLAAVGAAPRARRAVSAAYALVVGLVGAVLGALVGFVPGLAVTWPLTAHSGATCVIEGTGGCTATGVSVGPYIDVPWLLVGGVVVGLPLLTALVVALCTRSRLPMVARLT